MNKYNNIDLKKTRIMKKYDIECIKKKKLKFCELESKYDIKKCVYFNFRDKNNNYEFKKYYGDISKNDIIIYDNIIDREIITNINYDLYNLNWKTQVSISKEQGIFFLSDLIDNLYFHKLFFNEIIPKINYINKEKLKIFRCYINFNLTLQPGYWHTDGPGYGPTFLVYLNKCWKTEWEGQTAFYKNTKTKEIQYVDVVPGRLVIFKPYIKHRACDMSVYCLKENNARFTLAYHTYYEQ